MQKYFFILLGVILTYTLISCNEGGTESEELLPGRRDYNWSEDTLHFPGDASLTIINMYVESYNSIYFVGDAYSDPFCFIHYDGNEFEALNNTSYHNFYSVVSFKDRLFIGDGWGNISEYIENKGLTRIKSFKNQPRLYKTEFQDNKLYFSGPNTSPSILSGISIISYDGTNWLEEYSNYEIKQNVTSMLGLGNGNFLLSCRSLTNNKILTLDLIQNKENIRDIEKSGDFFRLGKRIFYNSYDGNIHEWGNNDFIGTIELKENVVHGVIRGRNLNDFFMYSVNAINHYNGKDMIPVYSFQEYYGVHGIFVGEDFVVFLVKADFSNYYLLLRGRLN